MRSTRYHNLLEDILLPSWEGALCVQVDPGLFFPKDVGPSGYSPLEAKKVCARCDIRIKCLEFALDHNIKYGVWGGTTVMERRSIKRMLKGDYQR